MQMSLNTGRIGRFLVGEESTVTPLVCKRHRLLLLLLLPWRFFLSFPFFFTVPASSGRHMGTDALWKHVRAKQKPPSSRLVFLFFFSLLPPEKNTSNWWETRPETSFSTHTWRLYLWLHSPKCVVLLFKNLNSTTTRVEKTFKRCSNLPLCFDAVSLTMLSFL